MRDVDCEEIKLHGMDARGNCVSDNCVDPLLNRI